MRKFIVAACLFLEVAIAQAKPSYSFGDEPRRCKADSDCALIIVSCHNCNWADAVNKNQLKESEATVRNYCEGWKKRKGREPDCKDVKPVKKRDVKCVKKLCEAQTFFAP